jgi:hypothetical protein
MDDHLEERGFWVTISQYKKETIEGWLIGEIPQGILVALDEDLSDVRLVSAPDGYAMTYHRQKRLSKLSVEKAREVRAELRNTNRVISDPMRGAISRIKFDRLHQFGHRSAELNKQIHDAMDLLKDRVRASTPRSEFMRFMIAQADRSTALHREVYETLEESGLTAILEEFGPKLARLPPELTIPAYDLEFESRKELISSIESTREEHWSGKKHRVSLEAAEETRTRLIIDATREHDHESATKSERSDDSNLFSRWIGPSLRVLVGTGLATANAAVGLTAGLTTTIVTIGATVVPTYVGVATSIYTGLAQVADGLEKIGRRN